MTQYFEYGEDMVSDASQTVGIVTNEFITDGGGEIEWLTGVNPRILRDLADLVAFCYPDPHGSIDIGIAPSMKDPENRPPALVIGNATDDRYAMAAPRVDCYVGPEESE